MLIAAIVAWLRQSRYNATLGDEVTTLKIDKAALEEAVTRLEAELEKTETEKSKLSELGTGIEKLDSAFGRFEQSEANRQQLLADVKGGVARGNQRIDALVGRWSNPKQRSQLGEAWLIGAVRRMGLHEGVHFEIQKRVTILGARATREGVIDILLRLPNANGLALDSKFPWGSHLASVLDCDEEAREYAVGKLRDALRSHVKEIARREYHRAQGVDIRHVLVVVPDWQTLQLVKDVDPQITEFAAELRVGLFPADGLYEIAAALGELHREEGWAEKLGELFSPADADRMYAACKDVLERVESVVKRHNSTGDAIGDLTAAFGPNGLMGRDILGPAARVAEKVEVEVEGEVKGLDPERA
ncbi:MAG: DNA recombination protein RmuC, partial [Solirubrobacterales bacterium]